jgi:hypothetical protein
MLLCGFFIFLTVLLFPDRLTLPLPAPDKPGGTPFDTTSHELEREVLTGLFLPETGPITSMAPLNSEWKADGTLGSGHGGDWLGGIPKHILRVEKPGYLPLGLRLLLILTPERSSIAQIQILWRSWKDGVWNGKVVPSPVWGKPAGPKDQTRVVTLLIEQGGTPVGLWGTLDSLGLRQVSLVLYEIPTSEKASDSPPSKDSAQKISTHLPFFNSVSSPLLPTPPTAPTVQLEKPSN